MPRINRDATGEHRHREEHDHKQKDPQADRPRPLDEIVGPGHRRRAGSGKQGGYEDEGGKRQSGRTNPCESGRKNGIATKTEATAGMSASHSTKKNLFRDVEICRR